MWVAKIKYKHDDCITMPKAVKYKITVYATPGNSYNDKKFIYNTGFLMIIGEDKNKQDFVEELKKDSRVIKVEVNKDLIVFVEKRPINHPEYSAFRSKEIMCVKPVYGNPEDGFEYWEICSWDKENISKFLKDIRKIGEATLLNIEKMKLNDVYSFHIAPNLTSKQKKALELATKYGYYELPRKVGLDILAKKMNITSQAFSEHLRKAESKLIPNISNGFL